MNLRARLIEELTTAVTSAVEEVSSLPDFPKNRRPCGYCTLMDPMDGQVLLVFSIKPIPSEKWNKYFNFSVEKARRLKDNLANGHTSSWQSRNPNNNNWGGAILARNMIISFSGLPELADEAVSLCAAWKCGWFSLAEAVKIATDSNNQFFSQMANSVVESAADDDNE